MYTYPIQNYKGRSNSDAEAPTAAIVAALEWRLLDLRHRENVVDD